jgi:polyphosphate kinase
MRLEQILRVYWADNVKAHGMTAAGGYVRIKPKAPEERFEAQHHLMEHPDGGFAPPAAAEARNAPAPRAAAMGILSP